MKKRGQLIGTNLLFQVNVWFLVCLFFCRGRLARCCVVDTSEAGMRGMGNKVSTSKSSTYWEPSINLDIYNSKYFL